MKNVTVCSMSRAPKQEIRSVIVLKSIELGQQQGERGLTMRAIAAALGMSATALYQHFDSKESIIKEIRNYGIERLADNLTPALQIPSSTDRLVELIRKYVAFARENPWLYSLMMADGCEGKKIGRGEPEVLPNKPYQVIRSAIRIGKERGEWGGDADVELISFRVWMAVHGLCSLLTAGAAESANSDPMERSDFVDRFATDLVQSCTSN